MERIRLTDWLRNQLRQDIFLIVFRHSGNDSCQWRLGCEGVLLRDHAPQLVEIDVLPRRRDVSLRLIFLNECICNVGACSHVSLVLRDQLVVLLRRLLIDRRGHGHGGHGAEVSPRNGDGVATRDMKRNTRICRNDRNRCRSTSSRRSGGDVEAIR